MPRPAHRLTTAALALAALTAATIVVALPASEAEAKPKPHASRNGGRSAGAAEQRLVGTWTTSTTRLTTAVGGQTIRMVVRTSVGGDNMRIRLSNLFGSTPVTFRNVHVGIREYGAEIKFGTNRPITFGGRRSVTVDPGRAAWSDPIPGKVPAGADVVVSLYLPDVVQRVTGHERAYTTTYLSDPGDYAADESGEGFSYASTQWYFLDRVAVTAPATFRSVVAFGDSLTDGAGQSTDANRRWTDYLRHRLAKLPGAQKVGVLNAGISGNRLLHHDVGPRGLGRFYRDALTQPGVRTVIVYEGINDISRGNYTSAKPLIEGYKRLIKMARARKVRILGGTLTPFYGFGTWTEEREEIRQQVNRWIRTSGAFDGVVDFDKAVRDPDFPAQLAPAYDSGDHLHMSDAGRRRLAYAVNLRQL